MDNKTKCLKAMHRARDLSNHLFAGYWVTDRHTSDFLMKSAVENLEEVVDAMGYTLTPKGEEE